MAMMEYGFSKEKNPLWISYLRGYKLMGCSGNDAGANVPVENWYSLALSVFEGMTPDEALGAMALRPPQVHVRRKEA